MTGSLSDSWRPIIEDERPYLDAVGKKMRAARENANLSRAELAEQALMSPESIRRIEQGQRRTRRPTLKRIVNALGKAAPEGLLEELVEAAGPALGREPVHPKAAERRYARREARRKAKRAREVREIIQKTTAAIRDLRATP